MSADGSNKVVEMKATETPSRPAAPPEAPAKAAKAPNRRRRLLLMAIVPVLLVLAGAYFWLTGGRYISTDNAYVGAQKVLITPEISGKVIDVRVREGQHVKEGDELFALDPAPYRTAVAQAEAKVADARVSYNNFKTNLTSLNQLVDLAEKSVALKQKDVERKSKLVQTQAGSQADVDKAASDMVAAELQLRYGRQQRDNTLNQLKGDPNLPLDEFPAYKEAQAALQRAERDLAHTVLRAPISGTATQVDNIQLGRFVAAGSPVFSVIDDSAPWVDANPKETDITYLRVGQKATIDVDSFPDRQFHGTVQSVSPGTGAQFSILPPQNASGNWVKVVQRVPVRIVFDKDQDLSLLRSGMSATIEIDTHHSRLPFANAQEKQEK
jgi:membrane fusion protein (multidrug efflux system)